jgi:molybdate transport system substrate-binding protein
LSLQPRVVVGQNIAQAFAWDETGNAELGLVALSQVLAYAQPGPYLEVDQRHYSPIRQDAILLDGATGNPAAAGFLRFLRSAAAAEVIGRLGYGTQP